MSFRGDFSLTDNSGLVCSAVLKGTTITVPCSRFLFEMTTTGRGLPSDPNSLRNSVSGNLHQYTCRILGHKVSPVCSCG